MTNEEALQVIEIDRMNFSLYETVEHDEAYGIAISAIEKQIPKKPFDQYPIDWGIGNYGTCQCGKGVNYQMKFCSDCGQALEWSEKK